MFAKFYYLHSDNVVLYWVTNRVNTETVIPSPSWSIWIIPVTEQ